MSVAINNEALSSQSAEGADEEQRRLVAERAQVRLEEVEAAEEEEGAAERRERRRLVLEGDRLELLLEALERRGHRSSCVAKRCGIVVAYLRDKALQMPLQRVVLSFRGGNELKESC